MNFGATILMCLTLAVAVLDWWAVGSPGRRSVELAAKPLTLLLLIGVALALQPADPNVRWWFVVALVFSLLGDIFLMFAEKYFVFGLASFLVGHLAYIAGFWVGGEIGIAGLLAGAVLVAGAWALVGRRILAAVRSHDARMVAPVTAYIVVISLMVISAVGTGNSWAIIGSLLFYVSDSLIAWNRFIQKQPWGRFGIITTYHLGQIGLVLSLL